MRGTVVSRDDVHAWNVEVWVAMKCMHVKQPTTVRKHWENSAENPPTLGIKKN